MPGAVECCDSICEGGDDDGSDSGRDHHCGYSAIVAGRTVFISENKQSLTFGDLVIEGILIIEGDLIQEL